ncbi:NRPS-like protein biosynthetic cluster [Apiospora rasikravindrae]|uniref:NRPS-like protein biosynthetic cluster n=1 Tax=Apiospora rasikravindrae TaxID=990691 RepID=A0ABR1RPZ7_9PEZI
MSPIINTMLGLLERAATTSCKQIAYYGPSNPGSPSTITYSDLLARANANAGFLLRAGIASKGEIVFLHLDSQQDYVLWFWSIIAAGAIPAVSTPLASDPVSRGRHLQHLKRLLGIRTIITSAHLQTELEAISDLRLEFIETLAERSNGSSKSQGLNGTTNGHSINEKATADHVTQLQQHVMTPDLAFLMLTSGSTGSSKAVELRHSQVLQALEGKRKILETTGNDVFLNWIGFDHVACVTEVHLHAMAVCANQIHIEPKLAINDPLIWLEKMSRHGVTVSFAPNFFLAAVRKAVAAAASGDSRAEYDLSTLRHIISGGEANTVATGEAFNQLMKEMGAKFDVLRPAFGMTETCAGSIYHQNFPTLEREAGGEFCSLGQPTHSMKLRIMGDDNQLAACGESGNLELRGPAVFQGYFNDPVNTQASFTNDGWFKTGDTGYIDEAGNLMLSGRTKDSLIINGVKYFSHELEAAIEDRAGPGLVASFTSAFSTWPKGADSEEIVVTIRATDDTTDEEFSNTISEISKATLLYCSKKPLDVIPLPSTQLTKSSLGKLSRSALKAAYEQGKFKEYSEEAVSRLSLHRSSSRVAPETEMERKLAFAFSAEFDIPIEEVGIDYSLVNMGVDSIRLLRYKSRIQKQLGWNRDIPIGTLLMNPSIRGMAAVLSNSEQATSEYNPVIVLQSQKSDSSPIWFVHPGLGEILVFLNVSTYFSDRRVYALRAPGFNPGEDMFLSIDHMTNVYMESILKHQPKGPYVLIGYSFGSMIAFETAKKLEAAGHRVGFMGSLNGPPHIKWRMVQLDWCELFLNLAYFLGFITEKEAVERSAEYHQYTKDEILTKILAGVPPSRLRELDMTAAKLERWAEISAGLQGLAHHYDPSGTVRHIDVFYARPLLAVGSDKERWLRDHLRPWEDFAENQDVRFHDSPGAHYTMLDADHVFEMQKVLRAALKARGV